MRHMYLIFFGLILNIIIKEDVIAIESHNCLQMQTLQRQITGVDLAVKIYGFFKKNNYCMNIIAMPNARKLARMAEGQDDGDLFHTLKYYSSVKEHAYYVPTPYFEIKFYLVGDMNGHKNLMQLEKERIFYVSGVSSVEYFLSEKKIRATSMVNHNSTLEMLHLKRGVVFMNSFLYDTMQDKLKGFDKKIIIEDSVHMFLHKKNAHLLPVFDKLIKGYLNKGGSFKPTRHTPK